MDADVGYFEDLAGRAVKRNTPQYSRFLNLAQQGDAELVLRRVKNAVGLLFGGAADCERKMLCFDPAGEPDADGFPIACLFFKPRNARFAAAVTHRDALGALMGLGIERDLLGDIAMRDGGAYLFCVQHMADFIAGALTKIGSVDVDASVCPPPAGSLRKVSEVRLQVSSARLDAVVAHLFRLSRGDAQAMFRQGKILVDDRPCERPDYVLKEGQVVSVRGFGRARYQGVDGQTRKGKTVIVLQLYS